MAKVIALLKTGFEEIEALTIVDYLRRAEIEVDMVSTVDDINVTGAHGITVKTDVMLDDINADEIDLVFVPGGMPGAKDLKEDERVIDLIKKIDENGHVIAAICAAPIVLEEAGVLKDKIATSYPGFDQELKSLKEYKEELIVIDQNVVTSRGPATAAYLALQLIELIKGQNASEEIKKDILLDLVEANIKR